MLDRAKPNERPHLVHIVPDRFIHAHEIVHVWVNDDVEQMRFAVGKPPKQAIEQRPTF
jgi:Zn-dependent peptidase ImmA (M78 family)